MEHIAIESGVMVMKNGKAWGLSYEDGHATVFDWIDPIHAPIHNPAHCKKPTDVTYKNSPYFEELSTAKLVSVIRKKELFVGVEIT